MAAQGLIENSFTYQEFFPRLSQAWKEPRGQESELHQSVPPLLSKSPPVQNQPPGCLSKEAELPRSH